MSIATVPPCIVYLALPDADGADVVQAATQQHIETVCLLGRRGYHVGWVGIARVQKRLLLATEKEQWGQSRAVFWPGMLTAALKPYEQAIDNSYSLYLDVLDGESCADLLEQEPYVSVLADKFALVSCNYDESDRQQIERLDYEPVSYDESVDSEVWMKASWLSYKEDDASLRFRFSFGMDGYEDVAADPYRQQLTTQLAQLIFPESALITDNAALAAELSALLMVDSFEFVERIVYFNAPDGGAQFHQDVERGHLGVIFAQLTGRTGWFALSKKQLIAEILLFLARDDAKEILASILGKKHLAQLFKHASDAAFISEWLDKRDNDALDEFINQTPEFAHQLVDSGYAFILYPGDVLLLPQQDMDNCAWHSVFCLDEEPGQALSFAIKRKA